MVKRIGSIRYNAKEFKSIPIHDLFYWIALNITSPLPETKNGNKYILVAIDHYSKWCEVKAVPNHTTTTVAKDFTRRNLQI
jgi:hypothetical protein